MAEKAGLGFLHVPAALRPQSGEFFADKSGAHADRCIMSGDIIAADQCEEFGESEWKSGASRFQCNEQICAQGQVSKQELQAIIKYAAMAESADFTWKMMDRNSTDLIEMKAKQGVKVVKTPKSVLEAQMKAWDTVIAEKSKDNPFFVKVLESQKQWAARVVPWRQEIMVDEEIAYNHFFNKAAAPAAKPAAKEAPAKAPAAPTKKP